jgi:hypothetical protein
MVIQFIQGNAKQSTLRTLKVLISILLSLIVLPQNAYAADNQDKAVCNVAQKNGVYQTIYSAQFGCINFSFNKHSRTVLLKFPNQPNNNIVVKRIEHFYSHERNEMIDYSPELIGMVKYMGFIAPKTIPYKGNEYLVLIYYERSTGENGGGECGAGAEGYLVAYRLTTKGVRKQFSKLVDSCNGDTLAEFPENTKAPIYIKNSYIYVDWAISKKFDLNGAIGKIRLSDGAIEYQEKPKNKDN